jgi:hypothetical protein
MHSIVRFGAALILPVASAAALAQNEPPKIIRGAIVSVDGANIAVKTRSGEPFALRLKPGQTPTAVVRAQLSDIRLGVFVGTAAVPGKDGTLTALEVHIFPEAQRGTGEGVQPFDLAPGSSMTNANVSAVVDAVSGPKLTLTYKGGEQTVTVDKTTPIVTFAKGEPGDLVPGVSIEIFGASKASDDAYEAKAVAVGRGGLKVPM